MSKTVCILYGLSEGKLTGKSLVRTLRARGFAITKNVKNADIIIAHSGGCFLVPQQTSAELILLTGLPYWPGKLLRRSAFENKLLISKTLLGKHHYGKLLAMFTRHLWYFLDFKAIAAMYHGQRSGHYWHMKAPKILLVRNRQDTYCKPDVTAFPFDEAPALISLSGHHEDLWECPEKYIDILQSEYGQ